jgi:hypothetical protein
MWIEKRGLQHRVYWRTGLGSPQKAFESAIGRHRLSRPRILTESAEEPWPRSSLVGVRVT